MRRGPVKRCPAREMVHVVMHDRVTSDDRAFSHNMENASGYIATSEAQLALFSEGRPERIAPWE